MLHNIKTKKVGYKFFYFHNLFIYLPSVSVKNIEKRLLLSLSYLSLLLNTF